MTIERLTRIRSVAAGVRRSLLAVSLAASIGLVSTLPAAAASNLTLSMTATWAGWPNPAQAGYGSIPGEPITYSLVIRNPATRVCEWDSETRRQICYWDGTQATGVSVVDLLPAGVTFMSANADSSFVCGLTANLVTCSNGSLGPGQTANITITVLAPSASTTWWPAGSFSDIITNEAAITGGPTTSLQTQVLLLQ